MSGGAHELKDENAGACLKYGEWTSLSEVEVWEGALGVSFVESIGNAYPRLCTLAT